MYNNTAKMPLAQNLLGCSIEPHKTVESSGQHNKK